jgi:hypothetical protein
MIAAWQRQSVAVLFVCVALLLVACRGRVEAQTIDDSGCWLALFARGDICHETSTNRFKWWFDGHARFFDDAGGFGQSIVRPGVGYALNECATVWMGYGWIRTSPGSTPDFDEHRVWQQLTWSKQIELATLGSRSRLEQRFLETGSDTGWRFRQFLSWRRQLQCAPRLSLVAWDEVFIHLNDTNWGANSGFDQNRLFLGFGWKHDRASRWRIETGYLNQHVDRSGRPDVTNHLVAINLYLIP